MYGVPAKYKPLIEAEQTRLGLPSKCETLGAICEFYFSNKSKRSGDQIAEQTHRLAPEQTLNKPEQALSPAEQTKVQPKKKMEVYISYVKAGA